ncbi:MAG: serine/threonine protein kinase [Deltaproteobacteria bacterium]|nr:serine/threonine protein kinase [Deltaproteobacteria bacterium]
MAEAATSAKGTPLAEFLGLDVARAPEIKRYDLLGFIGEGAMGRVFLGYDKKLDREVAIKVIADDNADDELRGRFYREAKVAAALNHPNIVKVMDYSGQELAQQFIVMERLHGHDLQHYLEDAPIDESLACAIAHELAQALSHAHASGLIHRDVKPENVFLEPTGRVVLIDFGLAKGIDAQSARQTFAASKTRLMGTPLFSSPEQLTGENALSPRSDLFSLGALMYYMVSQVTPFQGTTLLELLKQMREKDPTPLDHLVDPSPGYLALTMQLLRKDPAARPATADDVSDALKKLLGEHKVVSITGATKTFVTKRPKPKREVTAITASAPLRDTAPTIVRGTAPERGSVDDKTQVDAGASREDAKTKLTRSDATVITTRKTTSEDETNVAKGKQSKQSLRDTSPVEGKGIRGLALIIAASLLALAIVFSVWMLRTQRSRKPVPPIAETPEAPPPLQPIARTTLYVLVKPWGHVWIDGAEQGMTPAFRKIDLPEGEHTIEVKHPQLGTRSKTVTLRGEPEREVVVDFTQ